MIKELKDSGISFRYTAEQAARFRQNGWWEDTGLLDRLDRWTEQAPDRELVTDGVGRLTYGEARGQAYRLAAELRRLGVDRGDRVLVQLPNWNEFVNYPHVPRGSQHLGSHSGADDCRHQRARGGRRL